MEQNGTKWLVNVEDLTAPFQIRATFAIMEEMEEWSEFRMVENIFDVERPLGCFL